MQYENKSNGYQMKMIRVSRIAVGKRRTCNPKKVGELRDLIGSIGLRTPITVRLRGMAPPVLVATPSLKCAQRIGIGKDCGLLFAGLQEGDCSTVAVF